MEFISISDLFNKLPKYITYPVVVIIVGFIHVQGMFNALSNTSQNINNYFARYYICNLFDLLDTYTLPIPKETYIINGLIFLYSVSIQFLISLILFKFICWADKRIQAYLLQISLSKTYAWFRRLLLCNVSILFAPVYLLILYYIQFIFIATYMEVPGRIIFIRVINYILNVLYIFILVCCYKEIRNNRTIIIVLKNFIILVTALITIHFIYFNGYVNEKLKISWTLEKGHGMNFVKVFFKDRCINTSEESHDECHDENPMELLKIELNDKYIIGYHYRSYTQHNNTVEIIPIDKIDRIEQWNPSY